MLHVWFRFAGDHAQDLRNPMPELWVEVSDRGLQRILMLAGRGGGPSPGDPATTIPVVGRFPATPKKRKSIPIKHSKKRRPILNGSPTSSGNNRSPGVPGAGAAGGWRTT